MKTRIFTQLDINNESSNSCDRIIRLKTLNARILPIILMLFFSASSLLAQEKDTTFNNFNLDLHLKNMHLWQGFVVTPGVMMATSMEYETDNNKFVAGLWGGS